MKLNTSGVTQALSKEDIEAFKAACAHDEVILPTILKIVNKKLTDIDKPTIPNDFDQTNWALTKAFDEGQKTVIRWLLSIVDG